MFPVGEKAVFQSYAHPFAYLKKTGFLTLSGEPTWAVPGLFKNVLIKKLIDKEHKQP